MGVDGFVQVIAGTKVSCALRAQSPRCQLQHWGKCHRRTGPSVPASGSNDASPPPSCPSCASMFPFLPPRPSGTPGCSHAGRGGASPAHAGRSATRGTRPPSHNPILLPNRPGRGEGLIPCVHVPLTPLPPPRFPPAHPCSPLPPPAFLRSSGPLREPVFRLPPRPPPPPFPPR